MLKPLLASALALTLGAPLAAETGGRAPWSPALVLVLPGDGDVVLAAASTGFVQALNGYRAQNGRGALQLDPRLVAVAQGHAEDMARRGYFSHTGADGSSHGDRIRRVGYRACLSAENIAMGQRSEQEVLQAWVDSPGHRRNLLSGTTSFGLGRSGNVWVMVLARPC